MVRVNWTRVAVEDLKSISDYISKDSVSYAKLQVLRLKSKTHLLETNPMLGKIVAELENDRYRELIEGSYRIIYKVVSVDRVDILTIHHAARDLTRRQIE